MGIWYTVDVSKKEIYLLFVVWFIANVKKMEGKYKTRKENLGCFCSNYKHPLQILPFSTENLGC